MGFMKFFKVTEAKKKIQGEFLQEETSGILIPHYELLEGPQYDALGWRRIGFTFQQWENGAKRQRKQRFYALIMA